MKNFSSGNRSKQKVKPKVRTKSGRAVWSVTWGWTAGSQTPWPPCKCPLSRQWEKPAIIKAFPCKVQKQQCSIQSCSNSRDHLLTLSSLDLWRKTSLDHRPTHVETPAPPAYLRGISSNSLGRAHVRVGRAVHLGHVDLGIFHAVILVSQVVPGWLQPLAVSTPTERPEEHTEPRFPGRPNLLLQPSPASKQTATLSLLSAADEFLQMTLFSTLI